MDPLRGQARGAFASLAVHADMRMASKPQGRRPAVLAHRPIV